MFEDVRQVGRQSLTAVDPFAAKKFPSMQIVPHLNQRLGGHAADPGASGAEFTAIDQNKGLFRLADLAHGSESGSAGADDRNIYVSLHGVLLSCQRTIPSAREDLQAVPDLLPRHGG